MNRAKRLVTGLAIIVMAGLMTACASIQPEARAVVRDGGIAEQGDTVNLYYAHSKTAKEEFCPGAIVPVYRMGEGFYLIKTEVGKIRVVKELGDHYVQAVVTEGQIMSGDIATQPNSECLIQIPNH
ncbi:lipoprotein, putative [Geobacter metallireducens GS-15]|uniref:Lipoprotein, putative n=1 Tax=Geobacter metallireducens (strain ATCC 53774 / DSM 7210 / GS-15) TaxID=269799 RepID=Q39TF4_GEOMG|nr:hypothetical protein [Geobacter metallireducens]ABB32470.2 lipoprotein, putative [Geobacter metallireducens GS-15]